MTGVMCVMLGARNIVPLVGQASPSTVSATSSVSQDMSTGSTTASIVSGGTGPYTYSWSVSGRSGMSGCSANSPSSASTVFNCTGVAGVDTGSATGSCLITDTSNGRTVTVSVAISASFTGTPP
jgi:hypothetical protein